MREGVSPVPPVVCIDSFVFWGIAGNHITGVMQILKEDLEAVRIAISPCLSQHRSTFSQIGCRAPLNQRHVGLARWDRHAQYSSRLCPSSEDSLQLKH